MSAPGHRRPVGHARIEAARQAKIRAARRRAHRPYYIAGAVALVVVFVGSILLIRSDHGTSVATTSDTTQTTGASKEFAYGTAPCAPSSPPAAPKLDFAGTNGFMSCLKPGSKYTATFDTSAGTVAVDLDTANVPGTVNNFTQLAGYSYYNGSKLFRTDTSIGIIQGGGPHTNSPSDPGPGYTISDEGGPFTYQPGQLVMARTSQPNSAGSQFFFTVDDKSSSLDAQGTYVVFGTVTKGMDVLQKILASNVAGSGGLGGAPNPAVTVNSVTIGEASLVSGQ